MKSKRIFISTNLFNRFLELHLYCNLPSEYLPQTCIFIFPHDIITLHKIFDRILNKALTESPRHRTRAPMADLDVPPFPVNISKNQTSNRPLGTSRTQQSIITRFLEFRIEWRNWQVEYAKTFRLNPKARATLAGRSKTGRDSRSTTEPP